jgi:hypothetical protein
VTGADRSVSNRRSPEAQVTCTTTRYWSTAAYERTRTSAKPSWVCR